MARKKAIKKRTVQKKVVRKKRSIQAPAQSHSISQKKSKTKTPERQALSIVALVLNVLVLPGLGTLVGGRIKEGVLQLVLVLGGALIGIALILTVVGLPLGVFLLICGPIAGWIWGIVSGVRLIQEAFV
jgi:hypothetical protein